MSLSERLKDKSAAEMKAICESELDNSAFINLALNLFVNGELHDRSNASYIIKQYADLKKKLSHEQSEIIIHNLHRCDHWSIKLHILGAFPALEIEEKDLIVLEDFIRDEINNKNAFVRATAYKAFHWLCELIPEYKEELIRLCSSNMDLEKASVKAQFRQIIDDLERK